MSVRIMNSVWELDLPTNEKIVLLAYADHASDNGSDSYPSVALVARKTGFSERTVQRITRSLSNRGLILADGKGPHGTTRWRCIPLSAQVPTEPSAGAPSSRSRGDTLPLNPVAGVTPATQGSDTLTANPAAGVTAATQGGDIGKYEGVTHMSPESSLTIQEPSSRAVVSGKDHNRTNPQPAPVTEAAEAASYVNRGKIPRQYLPYADLYHELTGQDPTQRVLAHWIADFKVWESESIDLAHLRHAHNVLPADWMLRRPADLTSWAAAIKGRKQVSKPSSKDEAWHSLADAIVQDRLARSRRIAAEAYAAMGLPYEDPDTMRPLISDLPKLTNPTLDAEWEPGVPMPDAVREQINALVKSKSICRD